jgi:outer membrane protein
MHAVSRKLITGALLALGLAATAVPAHAVQKGDWLIRVGIGNVAPNDSSSSFSGAPSIEVTDVSNSTNLAINFTYMATDNIGVELLGALPFEHDVSVTGLGKVAEVKQLPPTLILLYNFAPKSSIRPYAGAGVNYTKFFDEKTVNALAGTDIELDSSTGLAIEAGIDVDINKQWYFNASVWRINIETTARSSVAGTADVTIDPTVLFLGAGMRF